jgi:hypothetical protein
MRELTKSTRKSSTERGPPGARRARRVGETGKAPRRTPKATASIQRSKTRAGSSDGLGVGEHPRGDLTEEREGGTTNK